MLDQLITDTEQRKRCVDAIGHMTQNTTFGHVLIVQGDVGAGKTYLIRAISDMVAEYGRSVRINAYPSMLSDEDIRAVKNGEIVFIETHGGCDIADEEVSRHTTVVHLDQSKREADVLAGLKKDVHRIMDAAHLDRTWRQLLRDASSWNVLSDGQRKAMASFMKHDFPEKIALGVYMVMNGDESTPLAMCSTRDKAIDIAEDIIKDGGKETASIAIYKTLVNQRSDYPGIVCWDARYSIHKLH